MGSIFRIAKAELIKMFKRPTVYIMAFILAGAICGSLFLFSPSKKEDTSVNMGVVTASTTINTYSEKFKNDPTYKSKFDESTTLAEAEILFFQKINEHLLTLDTNYKNLIESINPISSTAETSVADTQCTTLCSNFSNYIDAFKKANLVSNNSLENQPDFVQDYYNSTLHTNTVNELEKLNTNISALNTTTVVTYLKNVGNYNNLLSIIDTSYETARNPTTAFLKYNIKNIEDILTGFYEAVGLGANGTTTANSKRRTLVDNVQKYKIYVSNIIEYNNHTFAVIKDSDYKVFKNNIDTFINAIEIKDGDPNLSQNQIVMTKIKNANYVKTISEVIDQISMLDCDNELLSDLSSTIEEIKKRTEKKYNEITSFASTNGSSKDLNKLSEFNDLISEYKAMQVSLKNYVYYSVQNDTLKSFSNAEVQKFYGDEYLNVYNSYQIKEQITQYKYYIDNDIYSFELGNVFAFNMNSTNETTGFDFMYFALEIATVIIIVFSIFTAASVFAAEHDSGTIKLLLIRPFKRHKIVTGKLLATLFFSTIFLIFSTIVSAIIGFTVYPVEQLTPILAVFNATTAFKFNPIVLISIYIVFTLLEIIFYVILSSALCTLFKSYAGAVTGSFVAYFVTIAMNIGFGKQLWYSYSPFVNVNLFKYFGNGFLSNPNSSLSSFFNTPMLGNMNYFVSLGISTGLVAILLAITYIVFKRRDY